MVARYLAYDDYKNSGIAWLGKIPSHWCAASFKRSIDRNDGGVWGEEPLGDNDTVVLRSTEQSVAGKWNISDPALRNLSAEEKKHALLKEDDLLLTKSSGSSLHIGKTTLVTKEIASMECCYSNFMQRIRLNSKILPKLAWYIINNELARAQLDFLSNSTTGLANLNGTMIGDISLPISPVAEQTAIANFLDHETAKIDTLIDKQQQLIKLLQEKRQAVISHAVTKGLNPDAVMKDSGVEWLREVPEHWEIRKFKYLFKIRKRIAGSLGYDVLSITQKGIKIKDIESGEGQLSMDYSKYQQVDVGDFAMNHMDLLTGFVDISQFEGVTSPDYRVFTLEDKLAAKGYFLYLLQMGYINKLFFPFGQGAAQLGRWRLPTEAFNEFLAPYPPEGEQKKIEEYVERNLRQIARLESKAVDAICLMKERRTALISAAVTGKIDVRNWQPSQAEIPMEASA